MRKSVNQNRTCTLAIPTCAQVISTLMDVDVAHSCHTDKSTYSEFSLLYKQKPLAKKFPRTTMYLAKFLVQFITFSVESTMNAGKTNAKYNICPAFLF